MPDTPAAARATALLLDLDGTLADTGPDLTGALNLALAESGLPTVSAASLRPYLSGGGRVMVAQAMPDADEHLRDKVRHRFLAHYQQHLARETRLFPGMPDLLVRIEAAGLPWGVVTNKLATFTIPLLQRLGLAQRAACVISGDTLGVAKPHPEPLLHAARLMQRPAVRCLYVGDHQRDVEAGRRAGMATLVALFGYLGVDDQPSQWGADALIEHPSQIIDWLDLGA